MTLSGSLHAASSGARAAAVTSARVGLIGALAGTYGGHAARMAAIARIGAIPAAVTEDIVAIALAAFFVTR